MGILVLTFPIYRFYEPTRRDEARVEQKAFLAEQGGALFDGQCSACHGPKGRGALAPAIGSKNFLESVDDPQIEQLISLGMPGTEMVSFSSDFGGPMTSTDIRAITAYLRSLEADAESNALWRTPLANTDFTGEDLFTLACSRCHGIDRKGTIGVAPDISATSFAMDESDEWIGSRIRDGYKQMPRFGGVLNDQQIAQIVDYLRGGAGVVTSTTTTKLSATDDEALAIGKNVFEVSAAGVGCASCHGLDAQGTADGPNIIGSSKAAISDAIEGGEIDMHEINLTPEELEAVYRYLVFLTP
jgi:mono/diheme cytochrome c family protein